MTIEVLEDGVVKAEGGLASGVVPQLIRPFGAQGFVQVAASTLLFELNSAQSANLNTDADGTVGSRVQVRTQNGAEAEVLKYTVQKLVYYPFANRYAPYGTADRPDGDDWVRPSVMYFTAGLATSNPELTYGDFSNMNGGAFPPHGSHRLGVDVDCKMPGYPARDAATAAALVALINDGGDAILLCFVDYVPQTWNAFYDTIKNVTLLDGRKATDVIRPDASHKNHFHLRLRPSDPSAVSILPWRRGVR